MGSEIDLQALTTVAGAGLLMAVVVQYVKGYMPERVVPHVAAAIGVALAVAASVALGRVSATDLGNAALAGFLGGSAAVSFYQLQRPLGLLKPKDDEGEGASNRGRGGDSGSLPL